MNRKSLGLVVAGAVSAAFAMACLPRLQAEDPKAVQRKPKILQAAESALKATQAAHDAGLASVEDIYRWSRRVMKEELKYGANANAAKDHVERMRDLELRAEALFKKGVRGGSAEKYHATQYYHLKAQEDANVPEA